MLSMMQIASLVLALCLVLNDFCHAISFENFEELSDTAELRSVRTIAHSPPHSSLYGDISVTPAPTAALEPGLHPRVLFDGQGWEEIVSRYADPEVFDVPGSWSRHIRYVSSPFGTESPFLISLADMERNRETSAYDETIDYNQLTLSQREQLEPLSLKILESSEGTYQSFFLCALWTSVQEKVVQQGIASAFTERTTEDCILAAVAWAKVLLAHRAVNCANSCPTESSGERAHLWDTKRRYEVSDDWYAATFPMALTLDVLYDRFTIDQRRVVRSAIALFVHKKASWGSTVVSDRFSPNALLHPHRIFSNWAMYHSYLYLANLVLEGETDYDAYTSAVLSEAETTGFNVGLNLRFSALIDAYMNHSIYPDGSTFEDGYTYFIALREGSLGLLAAHRRGLNIFDTDRFRGLIHNAAQMIEPWHCGRIMGHSSGGGLLYPAWTSLFRYVYPEGPLPQMIWRHRMGQEFRNNNPCRIQWFQDLTPMVILGGEHGTATTASSPQGLGQHLEHFPLSYYSPRRGLLIARSSELEDAIYVHFDARPDSFLPGHDNADRGMFTYTAYRNTWIDDHWWKANLDSRRHSLLHIDGLAQDEKAPSVQMFKKEDDGTEVIAAADLKYAYNFQWARNWPGSSPLRQYVNVYAADGTLERELHWFLDAEYGHPHFFGWPSDDDGADLGFTGSQFSLNGDPDVGFRGMWTWRRTYRETALSWIVRSMILKRSEVNHGYFMLVDSVAVSGTPTMNTFESYLILAESAQVNYSVSTCTGQRCKIVLANGGAAQVDLHVLARGDQLSYRVEQYESEKTYRRVVIRSDNEQNEEIWLAFHAHVSNDASFSISRATDDVVRVSHAGQENHYTVQADTHAVERTVAPSPSPSASPSPSVSLSTSPSVSLTASPSVSLTASPSVSLTASPSSSALHSVSLSPLLSPSMSSLGNPAESPCTSHSSSPSTSVSASMTVSPFPTVSASAPPFASVPEEEFRTVSPSKSPRATASIFTVPEEEFRTRGPDTSPSPSSVGSTPTATPGSNHPWPYVSTWPVVTVAPMEPIQLKFGKRTTVGSSRMETDLSHFLFETPADYQVVFKLFGRSRNDRQQDVLSTCSKMTIGTTSMALYDCGDDSEADENYIARKCNLVHVSTENDICDERRTKMKRRLMRLRPYFLAVSVETDGLEPAQVQLRHKVSGTAGAKPTGRDRSKPKNGITFK
eukprot:TRINITY_DN256_c0_g1_i1.p1 TRINITY_DN256_c0_g1~~TRINITY_DN256_c0_g1_i1.p1  ORF type:complete len:1201 (-),score=127.86 TRINITY_DN256_c0_g1_i1:1642-5244(-)